MGVTYRFLATAEEAATVLEWFRSLPEQSVETAHETGVLFYFRDLGPLKSEPSKSPLVNVILPAPKREVLTTIGEVHFLATPASAFPGLNKVNKRFREWLKGFQISSISGITSLKEAPRTGILRSLLFPRGCGLYRMGPFLSLRATMKHG
jgi:hypothetical protein